MELAILAAIAVLLMWFGFSTLQTARIVSEHVCSINRELVNVKTALKKIESAIEAQSADIRRRGGLSAELDAKLSKIEYFLEKADTERGWFLEDVHGMDLTKRRMDHKRLERKVLKDLRNDFQEAGLLDEAKRIDQEIASDPIGRFLDSHPDDQK